MGLTEQVIWLLILFIGWGVALCVPAAIIEWWTHDTEGKET